MKIICKKNKAKGLDLNEVTVLLTDEFRYNLTLEKEYLVMGMRINKDSACLYYLIDEDGRPDWIPYMLFEITNNKLPEDWFIKVFNKKEPGDIYYLCGFKELVNDDNFHDLLIERNREAMNIYFKQKQLLNTL